MRRGTTPTLNMSVDQDLSDWSVYVTIKGVGAAVEATNPRLEFSESEDGYGIALALTQEETLSLGGRCEVQVRAAKEGTAIATNIAEVDFGRILKEGVIDG